MTNLGTSKVQSYSNGLDCDISYPNNRKYYELLGLYTDVLVLSLTRSVRAVFPGFYWELSVQQQLLGNGFPTKERESFKKDESEALRNKRRFGDHDPRRRRGDFFSTNSPGVADPRRESPTFGERVIFKLVAIEAWIETNYRTGQLF